MSNNEYKPEPDRRASSTLREFFVVACVGSAAVALVLWFLTYATTSDIHDSVSGQLDSLRDHVIILEDARNERSKQIDRIESRLRAVERLHANRQ